MLRRVIHKFTIWGPAAAAPAYGGTLAIAAAAAPVNSDAKAFLDDQISMLRDMSNSAHFAAWLIGLVLLWIAAYLWSLERERPAESHVHHHTHHHIYEAAKDFWNKIVPVSLRVETKPFVSMQMEVTRANSPVRPRLGNSEAAVFGIDAPHTAVVVDIKNFGNATAHNVAYEALCGVFPQRPALPLAFNKSGTLGISEPGHTQNIQFIFPGSISSAEAATFRRDGGRSLYANIQIDYESESGDKFRRSIALYLDPQAARVDGKVMLNICPSGNEDRPND